MNKRDAIKTIGLSILTLGFVKPKIDSVEVTKKVSQQLKIETFATTNFLIKCTDNDGSIYHSLNVYGEGIMLCAQAILTGKDGKMTSAYRHRFESEPILMTELTPAKWNAFETKVHDWCIANKDKFTSVNCIPPKITV